MNNLRPEVSTSGGLGNVNSLLGSDVSSATAFNFIPNNIDSIDTDNATSAMDENFEVFQSAMGSAEMHGDGGNDNSNSSRTPFLMQAAPAIDVTGQTLRTSGSQFLTPVQLQLQQQLRAKHAELSKRIIEQQEELRRISEQLLMTQYGLTPVTVTPVAFANIGHNSHPQTVGMAGPAVVAISQPQPEQPNMYTSLQNQNQTGLQPTFISSVSVENPISGGPLSNPTVTSSHGRSSLAFSNNTRP